MTVLLPRNSDLIVRDVSRFKEVVIEPSKITVRTLNRVIGDFKPQNSNRENATEISDLKNFTELKKERDVVRGFKVITEVRPYIPTLENFLRVKQTKDFSTESLLANFLSSADYLIPMRGIAKIFIPATEKLRKIENPAH